MNRIVILNIDDEEIHKAYQSDGDFLEIQIRNKLRPITIYLKLSDAPVYDIPMTTMTRPVPK